VFANYHVQLPAHSANSNAACRQDSLRGTIYVFLPPDARPMHSADYAVGKCLSVCLSVTRIETADRQMFSSPGSHTVLVFPHQTVWKYSDGDPRNVGVECRESMKNS